MQSFLNSNDLPSYINKTHQDQSLTAIKTEKNNIQSVLQTIKSEILSDFLKNEKGLMKILEQNEMIYQLIKQMKKEIKKFKSVLNEIGQHEVGGKSRLLKFFELFDDDMTRYVGEGRDVVFCGEVGGMDCLCLVLMTNDFVFIGKEVGDGKVEVNFVDSDVDNEGNNVDDSDGNNVDDSDGNKIDDNDGNNVEDSDGNNVDDNDGNNVDDSDGNNVYDSDNNNNCGINNKNMIKENSSHNKKRKKFNLINAYSYTALKITFSSNSITITAPDKLVLTGTEQQIKQIKDIYDERTYTYEETIEEIKNPIDHGKLEFLIETGQYDKLREFKGRVDFCKIFWRLNIENRDMLKCLLKVFNEKREIMMIMVRFVLERVQYLVDECDNYNVGGMVENVFGMFRCFLLELDEFLNESVYLQRSDFRKIDENNQIHEIDEKVFKHALRLILIEKSLYEIVEYISRRLFWRKRSLKSVKDILNRIEQELEIEGMDFKYVLDSLADKQNVHQRYRHGKFQKRVSGLIDEYLGEGSFQNI